MIVTAVVGGVLLVGFLLLAPLWRLVRWELSWDWRIFMFGWHSFWLGVLIGALCCFIAVEHWHQHLFH
jgi:hypothetical protein